VRIKQIKEQNAALFEEKGLYIIVKNKQIFDQLITKNIRIIDTKAVEVDYTVS